MRSGWPRARPSSSLAYPRTSTCRIRDARSVRTFPRLWISAEASRRAASRIESVLAALEGDYAGDRPYWYTGREAFTRAVIERAPIDFDRAFDRWRDLLAAAERAVELATKTLNDYTISPQERKASESRLAMGNWQRKNTAAIRIDPE